MSEELNQRDLIHNPEKIGDYDFRNIGSTTLAQLKTAKIISSKNYKDFEKRKPDAIISIPNVVNSKIKITIAVVENKDVSKFKTIKQKQDAIQQGLEVAKILEAKILIVTDTTETLWINALNGEEILDEKGRVIKEKFDKNNPDLAIVVQKIYESIDKNNSQIREPRLKDPTKLAKSIWQDLWMAAGATPENCLYSFVELFIFKYLSDLGIIKERLNYNTLMKMFDTETDDEVLEFYAENVRKYIKNELFPIDLSPNSDKTTIINGTIFVSKDEKAVSGYGTVFKKILKKFGDEKEGGGELKNIDRDFKSKLFETFLKESISKKNWGQYFTPLRVVRAIAKMAQSEIKPDITICDPACGVGKFLLEPLLVNNDIDDFFKVENGTLVPNIKLIGIDKGFDKEEQKTIILAKANMLIYLSDLILRNGGITKQFSDLFNNSFKLVTTNILGTLRFNDYENQIDLILTNPPYVTTGSSNLKDEIAKLPELQKFYKVNGIGVEGLFMEWIIRSLKPGGKAFIVVPDGIFNRQNDKNLRQFILDECIIDGIISLPLNTFFTTNKKTYILAITKKRNKADKQVSPVFTYLVSEIGESRDMYRFNIEQDNLQEAVEYFNAFKGNRDGFHKFNNSPRCKLFGIDFFQKNINTISSWIVDKWWSEEERISLGIIEKKEKVNLFDFAVFVEDISNTMKGFEEELKELSQKKKDNVKYQNFKLKDIFTIERGKSKYTKSYGNNHKGKYPVYSASNNAPLTFIDAYDYDGEYLTWATNGFAGYIKIIKGKFSFNSDRGLLIPKIQGLNLEYMKGKLQPVFRELAKGRKGEKGEDEFTKVYPSMIENIIIPLPILENGELDIEQQDIIEEKIVGTEEIKSKISSYQKQIDELSVEIDEDDEYKKASIIQIFDLGRGNSKFTQTYIDQNKGEYVVYSANTKQNGVFGYIDTFDYDIECLQMTTNGNAGTLFYREKHKFSINGDARILIKKDDNLDYHYLLYALQREFAVYHFNWENKPTIEKIKPIEIPIPINSKGEFDLEKQKEIAEKYRKVEEIKKAISAELEKVSKVEVYYE